jgi:predicted SnoaL-like aldol condensation-catalyzing enzyme
MTTANPDADTEADATRHRRMIADGYEEFFTKRNLDVLGDLLHDDFLEHSPGNPSGREAFLEYVKQSPLVTAEATVARVIADDDLVVVHYRVAMGGADLAVADIWRFEDDRIVEHWDVVQPVPDPELTPNGMF